MTPEPRFDHVLGVIPHYRGERWLARSIESLLNQTEPLTRLVVVDDGSETPPSDIVSRFPGVTLLKTPGNTGCYRIFQSLLDTTGYDAFLFQDADDWSLPPRLELLRAEARRSNAGLVGCQVETIYEGLPAEPPVSYPAECLQPVLDNPTLHPLLLATGLASCEVMRRIGGFATGFRYGADSEFIRRAMFATHVRNIPQTCYVRRVHPDSATRHPETGYGSPLRTSIQQQVRARALRDIADYKNGKPLNLSPLATAPAIALIHLAGPPLKTRSTHGQEW